MKLPHFSVRWLMVAVAIAAILLTTAVPELNRRWRACQCASARHLGLARMNAARAATYERAGLWPSAAHDRQAESIHRDLARKYLWSFLDPTHECVLDEDVY
jgi:Tfp pilus assembly protein FimT